MYGYEIPVNENAYAARERYLNDKKQSQNIMKIRKEYSDFVSNSRDYFLSEAMNIILQKSLNEETSEDERKYGKALVEAFVQENGSIKLINEFSKKTLLLANICDIIKESHEKVLQVCKEGDSNTFKITKTINDDFFDKLLGLDYDQITSKINQRVCDSLETYVKDNINDKEELEDLAVKTKEKIENIKARTVEERAKIVKEFTDQYNKRVYEVKNRSNRKVGVFEQLLHTTARNIVSDSSLLESFVTESGKLDMDKIRGNVTVMYTFLEMLNTAKMANVNESYIENIIKNM